MIRIILGILLAPWLYVLAWTLPLIDNSTFIQWVAINTLFAYLVFFIFATISHVVLRAYGVKSLHSYCLVMFIVAFVLDLVFSIWSLHGYGSYYYSQTLVVENNSITAAGYMLKAKEALINGFVSSCVMAVFWFTALYKKNYDPVHA